MCFDVGVICQIFKVSHIECPENVRTIQPFKFVKLHIELKLESSSLFQIKHSSKLICIQVNHHLTKLYFFSLCLCIHSKSLIKIIWFYSNKNHNSNTKFWRHSVYHIPSFVQDFGCFSAVDDLPTLSSLIHMTSTRYVKWNRVHPSWIFHLALKENGN